MCEQRYSEGGEGVKQISTGELSRAWIWIWALSLPVAMTLDKLLNGSMLQFFKSVKQLLLFSIKMTNSTYFKRL